MKVVSAQSMAALEAKAYQEGSNEKDFMENAGRGIAEAADEFIKSNNLSKKIWLLCGKGNNAGDAFVAGRYLLEKGYTAIAVQPEHLDNCSPLCQENGRRFLEIHGKLVKHVECFENEGIILDGIFGTGFKGQIKEPYASLIEQVNKSGLPLLAIDIPSGLNGTTGEVEGPVIHANKTLFLGLPKTGFFLKNGWNVVGKLQRVDFGLPPQIIEQAAVGFELLTLEQVAPLLPQIQRNRHKYQAGYVMGLAGSLNMPGAGLLSSLAAFRGGSGMVRLLYPEGLEAALAASPYELIKIPYSYKRPEEAGHLMNQAGALFLGPGLGRTEETKKFLQNLVPALTKPCVIDADALTLYAEASFQLPAHTILTPHTGEMQTLLKSESRLVLNHELLKTCQQYAEERSITLILKGAPTFIFHPGRPIFVNPTGDPGMATAGSGDVLTGLLAALLSQGLSCHDAAMLGVYLHGMAGELAAEERLTSFGMMASDIINQFAQAFAILQRHSH